MKEIKELRKIKKNECIRKKYFVGLNFNNEV